ncbi:MAG: SPOR domain-containing protein [Acidithiobacillus sp.]
MRDYKNQTSRPRAQEPRSPITPRRRTEPEEDPEETPPPPARRWPWVLLLLVVALSAGVWWWITQIPITTGRLGLITTGTGLPATTTPSDRAPVAAQQQPVSPAATNHSASPSATPATTRTPVSSPLAVATPSSATVASATSTRSGVDFNFYQILPKMHVDIPADILGNGPGIPSAATTSSISVVHQPVTIQVGAFTNRAAAVVLRDRLALLGVSTQMEKVEASHNNTLYRLRTGTFDSLAAAQPTLAKIRGMGITPLLLGSGIIGSGVNGPLSQSSPTP